MSQEGFVQSTKCITGCVNVLGNHRLAFPFQTPSREVHIEKP